MQVFKIFYKCLFKRITSVVIYISVFAVICVISAMSANTEDAASFKAEQMKISVFDHDNTPESRALYDYLADTQQLVNIKDDNETIADELYFRNIDYALIIPNGFSLDFTILENVKQPGSTSAYYMDNIINTYLKIFATYTNAGYSVDEADELTRQALNADSATELLVDTNGSNSSDSYFFIKNFFRYLPYIFIAVIMTSMGGILIIFRDKNISFRMKCSALSVTRKNFELSAACTSYSLLIWLIFMILALCFCGNTFFTVNGLLFILNSLVFMLFAVSVTYLISLFATSDNTMNVWSNVLGLGMAFLCGIFIPVELLSSKVAAASQLLPASWYIKAIDICANYNNSTDLTTYFGCILIQLLFAAACFSAALVVSKYKKYE